MEVAFGNSKNFRSEILPFEVVKFKSPYHALLGRPAYAKFMARPCYIYLKLKMPGPHGVITVEGSRDIALACEKEDVTYAESACAEESRKTHKTENEPPALTILKRPALESTEPGPSNKDRLVEHHSIKYLGVKSTPQPLHPIQDERSTIGEEQIQALIAGSSDALQQSRRITNPVLVLKKNGTRRMCLDYTTLRAVMPFGLHNATVIYRWQMHRCF